MNTAVTSNEAILAASRRLIQQAGWSAVNIRSVAAACGVSVGCIYHYFDSKAALMSAAVESIWQEIFRRPEDGAVFQDTCACMVWAYRQMESGCRRYPGFFTLHPLAVPGEDKSLGRGRMERAWSHMREELCAVLRRDPAVRPDAFTGAFTAEGFADLLFSLLLSAPLRRDYDPTAALEVIRRTLY